MDRAQPVVYGSDRLSRSADGWILDCVDAKGWSARRAATGLRSPHPGTVVDWNGLLYEVISAEPIKSGGIRYSLRAWDDPQAIRSYQRYDQESEAARTASAVIDRRREILRPLLTLASPLVGHLPGEAQRKLHLRYGVSLTFPTIWSAIPLLVICLLLLLLFPSSRYPLAVKAIVEVVATYVYLESSIRLANACCNVEPMGSLAGLLIYRLFDLAN